MPLYTKAVARRRKPPHDHEAIIYIRLTGGNMKRYYSTGEKVLYKYWSKKFQRVTPSDPDHARKNKQVMKTISKIREAHFQIEERDGTGDIDFKEIIETAFSPNRGKPTDVVEGFRRFKEIKESQLTNKGSAATYKILMDQLWGFKEEYYPKGMKWSMVNEHMIRAFIQFLDEGGAYKKNGGIGLSTIKLYTDGFQRFLKFAKAQHWHSDITHLGVKVKAFRKQEFTLNYDEIMQVYNLDLSKMPPSYSKVRDEFVFAWFTGIRYSDIDKAQPARLTPESHDGIDFFAWHYVSKKTKTYTRVGIGKEGDVAYEILQRRPMNKPSPTSTIHRNLRTIAQMAGLNRKVQKITYKLNGVIQEEKEVWECIHFHQGRSGYVTYLLNKGVPTHAVARLTGMTIQNIENYYRGSNANIVQQLRVQNEANTENSYY